MEIYNRSPRCESTSKVDIGQTNIQIVHLSITFINNNLIVGICRLSDRYAYQCKSRITYDIQDIYRPFTLHSFRPSEYVPERRGNFSTFIFIIVSLSSVLSPLCFKPLSRFFNYSNNRHT